MISQSWEITLGLLDFYIDHATTFFANTRLDFASTRTHEYDELVMKWGEGEVGNVAVIDAPPHYGILATGLCYPIPYLSEFFDMRMGVIDGLVINKKIKKNKRFEAANYLIDSLMTNVKNDYDFLSCNVPSSYLEIIQALEGQGFYYAEGFNNMVGSLPTIWS